MRPRFLIVVDHSRRVPGWGGWNEDTVEIFKQKFPDAAKNLKPGDKEFPPLNPADRNDSNKDVLIERIKALIDAENRKPQPDQNRLKSLQNDLKVINEDFIPLG